MLHSSWERAAEGRRTAAIVGGSSAEVARLNRTKQTNSFAHKLSWGALWNNSATRFCLAPLFCGHYIAAAFDVAGIETFEQERFWRQKSTNGKLGAAQRLGEGVKPKRNALGF